MVKIWTLKHDFCITDSDDYTSQIVDRPANVDDDDLDQPITPPQLASVPWRQAEWSFHERESEHRRQIHIAIARVTRPQRYAVQYMNLARI